MKKKNKPHIHELVYTEDDAKCIKCPAEGRREFQFSLGYVKTKVLVCKKKEVVDDDSGNV